MSNILSSSPLLLILYTPDHFLSLFSPRVKIISIWLYSHSLQLFSYHHLSLFRRASSICLCLIFFLSLWFSTVCIFPSETKKSTVFFVLFCILIFILFYTDLSLHPPIHCLTPLLPRHKQTHILFEALHQKSLQQRNERKKKKIYMNTVPFPPSLFEICFVRNVCVFLAWTGLCVCSQTQWNKRWMKG